MSISVPRQFSDGPEAAEAASPSLPQPCRTRWQPLRIGLVDLFYYDVEEFWFRDGRLLLRGNNGTGKSKVLALTLPFLLDGDLSAHRVEPDGDPKKRMEWNLLLGGEHPYPERLGYTWVEFGRLDQDGNEHFTTLGCGLKAATGRGIARHWFFVTDQRVGAGPEGGGGLRLLDGNRSAISRDRLAESLEGHGLVYDSARAYRRAVDEALFGLGEQRYGVLVDLLVQLRQPQLSKRPSEKALSRALTEALPPMDQAVVADVAEAFRSLDEEKDQLAAMVEAERAAGAFLTQYRRYARVAARRRARAPRREHSRYESLRAELAGAEEAYTAALSAIATAEARLTELDEERTRLRARDEALRAGPEMRSARALEEAAEAAHRATGDAELTAADLRTAQAERDRFAGRLEQARGRVGAAQRALRSALDEAGRAAEAARLRSEHAERIAEPLSRGEAVEEDLRSAAAAAVDRRTRTLSAVQEVVVRAERAVLDRDRALRRLEETDAELTLALDDFAAAEQGTLEAGTAHVTAVREHLAAATALRMRDADDVIEELALWTTTLHGPNPVRTAADAAGRTAAAELARRSAAVAAEQAAVASERTGLLAELAELEAGGRREPQPPRTRSAAARDGLPGAPLWRVVDFLDGDDADSPGLSDARRGGLEAALEASGVLDAWITPHGSVWDSDGHDIGLALLPPQDGPSLADVLRPAVDQDDAQAGAVSEELVSRLLSGIGLLAENVEPDAHDVHWVSPDGRFRLGPLAGTWTKPRAEYLGEGARQSARRTRMHELRQSLADLVDQASRLAEDAAEIRRYEDTLTAELHLPDDSALRRAHAVTAAAARVRDHIGERRAARETESTDASTEAVRCHNELSALAEELGLPADPDTLRLVHTALGSYREALASLWPAVREDRAAAEQAAVDRAEHERAAEQVAHRATRAEQAARESVSRSQRLSTLRATVGAAVAELQQQLAEVHGALRETEETERGARRAQTAAAQEQGAADALRTRIRTEIDQAVSSRAEAVEALRLFNATGLLAVALPDLEVPDPEQPWAADPAVRLARAVERDLEETDDSDAVWERVQRRITEDLKDLSDALARHGHSASARLLEQGLVVDVLFQGRTRTVADLSEALATEVAERKQILSAREQELLENHLITEVAGTLQELVSTAESQVARMNTELKDRPTSTGMLLRLAWRPARDAPGGLATARERLLRQTSDAWSATDRTALGEFLQTQIERARLDDPAGTWLEHLSKALDYRAWHEFGIERHQHGKWQSATGPASGGERVLSVSVPLFAAASSHYASAGNPYAPRLVTLDEAFAGVDDDSRAKSLGLLAAFDLDVVMTSEREWGCYPEVPGLSIAQLSRVDEVPAVLVTRWEWDGLRRSRAADPGPVPSLEQPPSGEQSFG